MHVNRDNIREVLIDEGKDLASIAQLLEKYPEELDTSLEPSYLKYIEDKTIVDVEFDGVLLSDIIKARQAHFFVALRDMNKLMSTAEGSDERLKWKRILTTNVYYE